MNNIKFNEKYKKFSLIASILFTVILTALFYLLDSDGIMVLIPITFFAFNIIIYMKRKKRNMQDIVFNENNIKCHIPFFFPATIKLDLYSQLELSTVKEKQVIYGIKKKNQLKVLLFKDTFTVPLVDIYKKIIEQYNFE